MVVCFLTEGNSSQNGAHLAVDGGQSDGSEGSFDDTDYDGSPGATQVIQSVEDDIHSGVPFGEGLKRLEEEAAPHHHPTDYAASSFSGSSNPPRGLFTQTSVNLPLYEGNQRFTTTRDHNGHIAVLPVYPHNPAFAAHPHGMGHTYSNDRLSSSSDNTNFLIPDKSEIAPDPRPSSHPTNDGDSSSNGSRNESPAGSTGRRKKPIVKTNYAFATPPDMSARLAVSTSRECSTDDGSETDEEDMPYLTFVDPVVPDFVPKMSDLLNVKYSNADQNTIFETAEAANRLTGGGNVPKDNTLPRTQAQRRAFVKAVFNAVKSTEHAEDNPGMIRPFAEGKYSDRRIEVLAWNILHTCVVRHTTGALLAPFEVKKKGTTELATFADRMAKVIECLTTQKTICKHLLDPYYLFQFVDDPVASQKRVLANKNLNKRKGDIMNAGKRIMSKSSIAGSPQSKIDDSFASETPSSFGPPHEMTPSSSQDVNDSEQTITPDGTINEIIMARNFNMASPAARRASLNLGPGGTITPHHMPRNTQQSSPSPAPKSGAAAAHIRRFHERRLSNLAAQRRAQNARTPSHSRNNSIDGSLTTSFYAPEQHHFTIGSTPGRLRSESTSTTASHKRRASEVDDIEEIASPKKRH